MYDKTASTWHRQSDWGLATLPEILDTLSAPTYFIGEFSPEDRARLAQHPQVRAIAPAALAVRRAGVLAALGWVRWQQGQLEDPVTLSPIYLG